MNEKNMLSDPLLDKLLQSKKYGSVCSATVERIYMECCAKYKKRKDAEKAAREKLHGITGAFLSAADAQGCKEALHDWNACKRSDALLERALSYHASTRERLPLQAMKEMYARIFSVTGAPASILDLACGINPLALGALGIDTIGVDISGAAIALINDIGRECSLPICGRCADLLCPDALPERQFDLALIFKALPLLEREQRGAASALLQSIRASYICASFPTRSLSGRNVGMQSNYSAWMLAQLPECLEIADSFSTPNELIFILRRKVQCPSSTSLQPPSET